MTQERQTQLQVLSNPVDDFIGMFSTRRPNGSKSERKFIARYLTPLGAEPDKKGNCVLRIGTAPIMWSCHTDSVHNRGGLQLLKKVGDCGLGLSPAEKHSNCLGADDAAGIWLMCEMIRAKVEGLYVFHREEEIGCKGSSWIVKNNPLLVEGIKFAVALDRKGKTDIITKQSGSRCCSDEFAKSLGDQLDMGYSASPWGAYTDTARYTGLIGECTNLSVGYTGQHSKSEEQDCAHLIKLRERLIRLDVTKLVSKRKPGEVETYTYESSFNRGSKGREYGPHGYWENGRYVSYHDYSGLYGYSDYGGYRGDFHGGTHYDSKAKKHVPNGNVKDLFPKSDDVGGTEGGEVRNHNSPVKGTFFGRYWWAKKHREMVKEQLQQKNTTPDEDETFVSGKKHGYYEMARLIRNHAEEVADYLEQNGVDITEIEQYILSTTGTINY